MVSLTGVAFVLRSAFQGEMLLKKGCVFTTSFHLPSAVPVKQIRRDRSLSSLKYQEKRNLWCSNRRQMNVSASFPGTGGVEKPKVVFVLGGPGAGKGTQCSKIVSTYGFKHLSAGDLLREERNKPGSEFGELIERHITGGTIVPVSVTCSLIEKAILCNKNCNGFLVDGFPRNQDNLDGWEKQMTGKVNVLLVLFFDVPEDISIQRCLRRGEKGSGRSDDNLDVIKKRITTYHTDTLPIIQHYMNQNLVQRIDASKSVGEVFAQVQKCLDSFMKPLENVAHVIS